MPDSRRNRCALALASLVFTCSALSAGASQEPNPQSKLTTRQQLARDIYQELVEINTTQSVGDTFKASQAMAARLKAAGFADSDVQVFETAPKRGNLVARLRGAGKGPNPRKPILLLAHIDVVEANRDDWSADPFKLLEQDGYFYGRGTGDDKFMAAAFVTVFARYQQEGYRPDRDIILALTTDEEIGDSSSYGINFLLNKHRDLIDAEFALNEGGGVAVKDDKVAWNSVQTTEKQFQSFWLETRNKGGHSSQPTKDNAIYRLSEGLARLSKYDFPVKLNETTRAYFQRMSALEQGQTAADMKAVVADQPDPAAVQRLSERPLYNSLLRTTCVATRIEGGHADNALPQLARALVNCRIVPGDPVAYVQQALVNAVADDQIKITLDLRETSSASKPSPLNPQLFAQIEKLTKKFWPSVPVIPIMSTGATDGRFLRDAGIPTYGHSGLANNIFDVRAHGKDERIPVKSFYEGQEYLYQLVKALAGGK